MKFKIYIWNLIVNSIAKSWIIPDFFRYYIYKLAGMQTKSKNIRSGCIFRGKSIFIGKNVLINHNCFIDAFEKVEIKDNVSIAYNVTISTSSHKIGNCSKRAGIAERRPVIIGQGCWIGASSTILSGVTIADGCIIGAGSVVTADTEPNCLYVGVPARKIKAI